jgi:hypothetical protein
VTREQEIKISAAYSKNDKSECQALHNINMLVRVNGIGTWLISIESTANYSKICHNSAIFVFCGKADNVTFRDEGVSQTLLGRRPEMPPSVLFISPYWSKAHSQSLLTILSWGNHRALGATGRRLCTMLFSGCPNDNSFGPTIYGCRDDFDFTITFERIFFSLVPSSLFTATALGRVVFLAWRPRIVQGPILHWAKLVWIATRHPQPVTH